MNISDKLTLQQLCEILVGIVDKGNDSKNLNVSDAVDDIKQQVLTAIMR